MHDGKITIMTIRHGQTDFNRQKRYAGLIDVPLNDKGASDCRNASACLRETVDVVVASKLTRAIETARILTDDRKQVVECALCNERNFGAMQGRTYQEVEHVRPEIKYLKIGGDFHSLNPPQGERFPALYRRARRFFKFLMRLAAEPGCARVLVVSHEVFLLQFHGVLRGETWREALRHSLPNLMLSVFTLQGNRLLTESSQSFASEAVESKRVVSPHRAGVVVSYAGSAAVMAAMAGADPARAGSERAAAETLLPHG